MSVSKAYQSYLFPECKCEGKGVIVSPKGEVVCRWCRKPWAKGAMINYRKEHFDGELTMIEQLEKVR